MDYDTYYENYDRQETRDAIKRILIAFLVGGLISSVVTLFITPTTGRQARRMVQETVDDVRSKAGQVSKAVKEAPAAAKSTVNEATATAQRRASKLKGVAGNVIDEQKESLQQGIEDASEVLKSG